jgi:hypothetical protein
MVDRPPRLGKHEILRKSTFWPPIVFTSDLARWLIRWQQSLGSRVVGKNGAAFLFDSGFADDKGLPKRRLARPNEFDLDK